MLEVLRDVHLEDLIGKDGLATDVGEGGAKLSGGQKQRIGIARALLKDSELMLFDEPTSSLDIPNEKGLLMTIDENFGDKTVVMISHRNSTLGACCRVCKVRDGWVAEEKRAAE